MPTICRHYPSTLQNRYTTALWAGDLLLSVATQGFWSQHQLLCGLKMIAMFSLYFGSCENEGKILVASGCKSSVVHSNGNGLLMK